MALNASAVRPQRFRSADHAQLMEWAAQGVSLLGIDRIRHYARRTRQLNRIPVSRATAEDVAEFRRMWPRSSAFQPCYDAAWGLLCAGLIGSHTIYVPPPDRSGL